MPTIRTDLNPANLVPIKGDKTRRVIDTTTGVIYSRRTYQQVQYGTTIEQHAKKIRIERQYTPTKWKTLYDNCKFAYAKKHNLPVTKVRQNKEFQHLYKELVKEIKNKNKKDRLNIELTSYEKQYLIDNAKMIGLKEENDYTDFGQTPTTN